MKLLVLGGNGRTGQWILQKGLERGHELVALVRDPNSLKETSGLRIVRGTPTSSLDLAKAAEGSEAILVALNNPRTSDAPWAKPLTKEKILKQVAKNIIALGKTRVVFLSANGVGDSFEHAPGFMRFMITKTNMRYAYADHNAAEDVFRRSNLDWTLVRPNGLSNSTKAKELIVGSARTPKPGMMIRRSTVAEFMLDCVENDTYLKETPVISEK